MLRKSKYLESKTLKSDIIIDLPSEKWLNCVGYEGYYMVSNKGRVKSVYREIKGSIRGGGSFRRGQKLIKFKIGNTGYYTCTLSKLSIRKDVFVHRLAALAFIKNKKNLPFVNHLDFNKLNNSVENLEWCNQKRNVHHAIENGRIPIVYGENTSCNKLTSKEALEIFNADGLYEIIASKYGVCRGQVGCIKSGKCWSHLTGKQWVRVRPFRKRNVKK